MHCVRNSFRIREYFDKSEFEFSRFYSNSIFLSEMIAKHERTQIKIISLSHDQNKHQNTVGTLSTIDLPQPET